MKRYRVPDDQAVLLVDPTKDVLKKSISELFERVEADSQVVVYFAGHAWRAEDGVYLAPKDFSHLRGGGHRREFPVARRSVRGVPGQEKFLLLDACNADRTADANREPSTEEMFRLLKGPSGQAAPADSDGHRELLRRRAGLPAPRQESRSVRAVSSRGVFRSSRQEPRYETGREGAVRLSLPVDAHGRPKPPGIRKPPGCSCRTAVPRV